jgi:hypothetical protein
MYTIYCIAPPINPITQLEKPDAIMERKQGNGWDDPDRLGEMRSDIFNGIEIGDVPGFNDFSSSGGRAKATVFWNGLWTSVFTPHFNRQSETCA